MTVLDNFDPSKEAFLNPGDFTKPVPDFPETCITVFSEILMEKLISEGNALEIASLYSENNILPIYKVEYKGKSIGIYMSRVGGPASAAGFEEVIAMGAQNLVLFGCSGILDGNAGGKIIVPTSAIRDEGTSYHYLPPQEEICVGKKENEVLVSCLERLSYPYIKGKVWTTDAIYRETKKAIHLRKNQGCLGVEMECASMLAVANFRNVSLLSFFYGADRLDGPAWDAGDLMDRGKTKADQYVKLALECARLL